MDSLFGSYEDMNYDSGFTTSSPVAFPKVCIGIHVLDSRLLSGRRSGGLPETSVGPMLTLLKAHIVNIHDNKLHIIHFKFIAIN